MNTYSFDQSSGFDPRRASVHELSDKLNARKLKVDKYAVKTALWDFAQNTTTALATFGAIGAVASYVKFGVGLAVLGCATLSGLSVAGAFAANKQCLKSKRNMRIAKVGLANLASDIAHKNPAAHAKIVKLLTASTNPRERELAQICAGKMPHRLAL